MSSPILELLPSIHVTIVGVVAAFFSAFVVFAFQKVQDAEDKKKRVLKGVEEFDTPNKYLGSPATNVRINDGLLNWKECRREVLYRAARMFSDLDKKASHGINIRQSDEPSDQEVKEVVGDLMLMLYYVFTTYPFSGISMVSTRDLNRIEEQKSKPFDESRITELQNRINFLKWNWESGRLSIIELAKRYDSIRYNEEKEITENLISEMKESFSGEVSENDIEEMVQDIKNRPVTYSSDSVRIITDYFEKVFQYEQRVIPALFEALSEYKMYNERFKIKKWSLIVIKLVIFILTLGVFIPLVTLEVLEGVPDFNWNNLLMGWFEFFVLVSTLTPYFYACLYFYRKVKGLTFD
ncbi:hypothetical protein DN730_09820 [Marinomonas piezotolerans]|uniref:Uncharacterized protein n=1 Tax=Marinomonas piezotolerans TaxID=2213058 RepID=A0A370UA83_9GAMM|nr:hypothetical protein [Marinomonas piezotolerans]RDL44673.1 hypothetical protein DN730_09820 [Marinomonas piezotolerans]